MAAIGAAVLCDPSALSDAMARMIRSRQLGVATPASGPKSERQPHGAEPDRCAFCGGPMAPKPGRR